jgi:hypothetical protein
VEEALTVVDPAKIIGLVFNGDDPLLALDHSGHYTEYHRQHTTATGRWGRAIKKMGASLGGARRGAFEGHPDRESE